MNSNFDNVKGVDNAKTTLKGSVEILYSMVERKVSNFVEFEQLFLKQYWSEIEQERS